MTKKAEKQTPKRRRAKPRVEKQTIKDLDVRKGEAAEQVRGGSSGYGITQSI